MSLLHGFISVAPFYDDKHFPHGFRKSGDFNIVEAELLTELGKRLFMLEHGLCTPENYVEIQFVEMCKSQGDGQTKVEMLWRKYKVLTTHKAFHCLNQMSRM